MKASRWTPRIAAGCLFLCASVARSASLDFGPVKLAARKTAAVTVTMAGAARLARIAVRTQGKDNADFLNAGKGSCKINKFYAGNRSCTVKVTFKPRYAGLRLGAVVLADKSGKILATTYVYGVGLAPQTVVYQEARTTIDGLRQPNGLAVDERGYLYIITNAGQGMNSGCVQEELPLPSGNFVPVPLITGIYQQRVVATDGNGNIFVAGVGMYVYKETPHMRGAYAESTIGGGMGAQCGLAVDGAGNVSASDCNFNRVYKETLSTTGSYVQSVIRSGLNGPAGLAVDGDGNLYIAVLGDKMVYKETPSGDSYSEVSIGGTFEAPQGVALDGAGNVYVSDFASGEVYKETVAASGYIQSTVINGVGANYVAVDGAGNLYVSDLGQGRVIRISLANRNPSESQ